MIYPWNLPNPIAGGTWPDNPSASGGEAQNGMEQNVFNMSMKLRSRWTVAIRNADDVLAARQFQGRMKGKSNLCLVPLFDGKRVSWPVKYGVTLTPRRTRNRRLDGTPYASPAVPGESDVQGLVVFDIDYHATEIVVIMQQGGPPKPGQWFCLAGSRSYLIEEVAGPNILDRYTLTFTPPLREPAFSGDVVDFAKLFCLMNQVKADQGVQVLDGVATAVVDYEFIEGFDIVESGSGDVTSPIMLITEVTLDGEGGWRFWPGGEAYIDLEGVPDGAIFRLQRKSPLGTPVYVDTAEAVNGTYNAPIGVIPLGFVRAKITNSGASTSLTAYISRAG